MCQDNSIKAILLPQEPLFALKKSHPVPSLPITHSLNLGIINLFCISEMSFQKWCINGITHYENFLGLLSTLSLILWRSIQVNAGINSVFLSVAQYYSSVCVYQSLFNRTPGLWWRMHEPIHMI